jgi:hypothetical protein
MLRPTAIGKVASFIVKHFRPLTPNMKLYIDETVNKLNIQHRTSNIERPISMTLRFIYFKTNEPLNTDTKNFEG